MQLSISVAYLGGPLGHDPLLAKNFLFHLWKKLIEKRGLAPLCVSTSGQRKFGHPLNEILNMLLVYIHHGNVGIWNELFDVLQSVNQIGLGRRGWNLIISSAVVEFDLYPHFNKLGNECVEEAKLSTLHRRLDEMISYYHKCYNHIIMDYMFIVRV